MSVSIQSELKRAYLRQALRDCADNAMSLGDSLNNFQVSVIAFLKGGRVMTSTSGGGYSTSWQMFMSGSQITQEQILSLSEFLLTCYEQVVAALSIDGSDPANNNTIFQAMLQTDQMQSVTQVQNDYLLTRQPYGTGNFGG